MLLNLYVKNLALIDEAEVEFTPGLNIMTGETGAGKSIIIGSVSLALGAKAQKEMIRENAPYGLVELTFQVKEEQLIQKLGAMDIILEDGYLVLSRKIINGRSISKINSESVPVSKVKEVAALLIDIHGQHEHQSLLVRKNHLNILDGYAKGRLKEEKERLKNAYATYKKIKKELSEADIDSAKREREISFLEYEVEEIETANVTPGEDMQLESDYRRLLNGQKIMEAVSGIYEKTSEGYTAASEQIGYALRELSGVSGYDMVLAGLESQLIEIDSLLNDFNREVAEYISDTSFDEETFAETEKRLDTINRLKAKYGSSIEDILSSCSEKKERLAKLSDYDAYLAKLKQEFKESEKAVSKLCSIVSEIRKEEAAKLTERIRQEMMDLNFPDVSFSMAFRQTGQFTANGYDDAEFLISTNPGEAPKPLEKIASGGELSRIMLAIKSVLADSDDVGALIFDEIDTGISGRTAQMVSEKMNLLGRSHQIICITHLPQIAAMADSHYLIQKSVENQTTVTTIGKLSKEESVTELARMLGGVKITDTVLDNAREMKELAANTKKSLDGVTYET